MPKAVAQTRPAGHKARPARWWAHLYVQFLTVAFLLLILEILLAKVSLVEPGITSLDELQKKRLDTYLDLTKLLLTGAGVTLGAVTGFVLNRDKTLTFSPPQMRKIVWSWGLAGFSLYCGYFSIHQVIWMLTAGFFDLYEPHLWIPSRVQFLSLLASIVVFADFIHGSLNRQEESHEKS